MRHKKIPTKNRKKLKQVDPFNKKGALVRAEAKKKLNWTPKGFEQPLSKSEIELKELTKLADVKEVKRRKKEKNKILEEAKKAGLEKGRFEGIDQFIKRVERTTYRDISEHKIMMKQGLTGRAQKDIDEDIKLIEDKEKKQKELKQREIQNKIKAAREERERRAKAIQDREDAKQKRREERQRLEEEWAKEAEKKAQAMEDEEEDSEGEENDFTNNDNVVDDPNEDEGEDEDDEDDEDKLGKKKIEKELKVSAKPAKRAEKEKVRKAAEAKAKYADSLLNSREIIKFGERYDEPPKFEGVFKKKFDPLMAKAGGKTLLLHSILQKETGIKTQYLDHGKRKADDEDRLKVIEAYRELKRNRQSRH